VHELRPVNEADRQRLLTWRNLPDVSRWMYTDHTISQEEHDAWFDRALTRDDARFWIIVADGIDSGMVSVSQIDLRHGTAFWAFYLAEAAVRGRGVGAFTEFTILELVFGEMGLRKLNCEVLATNPAVVAMHERFGFQREGLFRAEIVKSGVPTDVHRLGILAEEWAAIRNEHEAALLEKGILARS
jgi:UDP-4-amino-4,6-dideoxy-N-acetyl-beta-L-altrosamine N-acetyltransferase